MKKNTVLLELDYYDDLIEASAILDKFLNNTEKSFKINSQFIAGQVYESFFMKNKVQGDQYYNTYFYVETDIIKELTEKIDELVLEKKDWLKRESDLNYEVYRLKQLDVVEIVKWWKFW